MKAPFWYRGHGLLIRSDIDLPEFAPTSPGDADLTITLSAEPAQILSGNAAADPARPALFETSGGVLFAMPDLAAFHVQGGRRVDVTTASGFDPGALRLFLIGTVSGILFHQRGQHVLHGSAVVRPGDISLFVGESGAGKSTLAAHLGLRGYRILADDTLVLHEDPVGRFVAWPGSRVFKLWADALEDLGTGTDGLARITNRDNKYFLLNPVVAEDRAHPLDEIIVLDRGEGAPRLTALTRLETLGAITAHTYRPELLARIGRVDRHFQSGAALAGTVRGYRLTRPWHIDAMDEVLGLLETHWQSAPAAASLSSP